MKIKYAQFNVVMLSRPNFDDNALIHFLENENLEWLRTGGSDAEELVEVAGRVCYLSFGKKRQSPKNNQDYIANLIAQGHESVLEHVNWTFILSGVSRGFTHQLVRHRAGFAYSQLSQQYHDESEALFVVPPSIERNETLFKEWSEDIYRSLNTYRKIISTVKDCTLSKRESLRELRTAARSALPNATETKIVVTANARALRHFFNVRGSIEGDWEMRKVACAVYDLVIKDAPSLFPDFYKQKMLDGSHKLIKKPAVNLKN
ncbi:MULTISPECIES: FAD-dependent thymidylate synthase [Pseudoalteromonas]|mgnify:CR=1 FL=1|jgi:thymidylate synthase (FAD)|uniref:Flavin-dependent thymidylate synthase n=1 Tax=Pseudoalteromonas arctica TaxID=394751 RepID=A0A7X9U9W0_9GAMM|nr:MULTISPECIES: FAD-dependent thymidylate synthase [Pseudoalteromonas]MBB1345265.1 FAD-dependent thymidylate synthase [Pseudoalteromonas sp. SG45-2]NMF50257.1 FAD-dependent thymidylate synthase [Pseudoalteromonas arctica]